MTRRRLEINKITIFAMFLTLGWLLPFLTFQSTEIGNMFSLMHLPVIIGGFILGPIYGILLGVVTPLTRTLMFGMPPIYPVSLAMAVELGIYGLVSGFLYNLLARKLNLNQILSIYISLISAMILGRAAWGFTRYFMGLAATNGFTFAMFLSGAFITAYPGIILQLILIPAVIYLLNRLNILDKYFVLKKKEVEIKDAQN